MKTGDSDDPAPEGWTVKVKIRSCGKKDECYFPSSGEAKFYSKLEVVRYLNNSDPKSEEQKKGFDKHSSKNVVIVKDEPEGLPPGWTKKIKVTKKAHKIRRDLYYTDPVSEYVFRSMKDALRYLKTGEVGKLAFKPKDKGNNNVNLEDDKAYLPGGAKKQKLAVKGTMSPIISEQSSKSFEVTKYEAELGLTSSGESMPISKHASSHCVVGAQSKSSQVSEDKDSYQTDGKNDPAKNVVVTTVGVLQKEHSLENRAKDETKKTVPAKSKKKKELNPPRRASKRLAGLPLDPTPELKTPNRVCRASAKQSNDMVAGAGGGSSYTKLDTELGVKNVFDTAKNTKTLLKLNEHEHPCGFMAPQSGLEIENHGDEEAEYAVVSPIKHLVGTENEVNDKREHSVVSPPGNVAIREEYAGKVKAANNADENSGLPLDLPLGELWQDPCIAFAIKTLTGISFDNSDSIQVSSGSNNSEFGALATSDDHSENVSLRKQVCTVIQPLGNIATSEEHAGEIENSDKGDEKPGSPLNISFVDEWADPCIEFAIKTLTGAIPLDYDMVTQDSLQQKASSSQSLKSSCYTLQNARENPDRTKIFCQKFGIPEKPLYNEGTFMEPALPHATSVNLGYSGGTVCGLRTEARSKGCER